MFLYMSGSRTVLAIVGHGTCGAGIHQPYDVPVHVHGSYAVRRLRTSHSAAKLADGSRPGIVLEHISLWPRQLAVSMPPPQRKVLLLLCSCTSVVLTRNSCRTRSEVLRPKLMSGLSSSATPKQIVRPQPLSSYRLAMMTILTLNFRGFVQESSRAQLRIRGLEGFWQVDSDKAFHNEGQGRGAQTYCLSRL